MAYLWVHWLKISCNLDYMRDVLKRSKFSEKISLTYKLLE